MNSLINSRPLDQWWRIYPCFRSPDKSNSNATDTHSLTKGQVQHDLLLLRSLSPEQSVHSADEPRDHMPRELHQPHQRPYAAPRGLLTGAHPEPLGQPEVDRQQKPDRDGKYRLAQTDGKSFGLRSGAEVGTAGAPAAGMTLRRCPVATHTSTATVPPRRR